MNWEKMNNKFDLMIEKARKGLKEFFCVPFFGLFWIGTGIAMLGWIGVELITGEKIKEIRIVKDNSTNVDAPKSDSVDN